LGSSTPFALPDAQTTRNCLIIEGDNGVLLNSRNGQVYNLSDAWSKKDPTWATMRRRTRQPSKPSNNSSPRNLSWLATKHAPPPCRAYSASGRRRKCHSRAHSTTPSGARDGPTSQYHILGSNGASDEAD
jgi:hypothetical protein